MSATQEPVSAPEDRYVRHRHIPQHDIDFVDHCDELMMKHGYVVGSTVYSTKYRARTRVRRLKRLMVELRRHQEWQLRTHLERARGGWTWNLEYLGRNVD